VIRTDRGKPKFSETPCPRTAQSATNTTWKWQYPAAARNFQIFRTPCFACYGAGTKMLRRLSVSIWCR